MLSYTPDNRPISVLARVSLRVLTPLRPFSATRQACVVWLKNRVNRAYRVDITNLKAEQQAIPASDRLAVKQNVILLLIAAPSRAIRVQLTACVKCLVSADFPEQWPDLIDHVITLLQSDDLATVYGGLLVNLEVFKSYKCAASGQSEDLVTDHKFLDTRLPKKRKLSRKSSSEPSPSLSLWAKSSPLQRLRPHSRLWKQPNFCMSSSRPT